MWIELKLDKICAFTCLCINTFHTSKIMLCVEYSRAMAILLCVHMCWPWELNYCVYIANKYHQSPKNIWGFILIKIGQILLAILFYWHHILHLPPFFTKFLQMRCYPKVDLIASNTCFVISNGYYQMRFKFDESHL